jgi:hypothetical protein
VLLLW